MIHLLIAYQALVVMTGIVTTILLFVCHKKKSYLAHFQLFYFCFTLVSLLELLSNYALSNIREGLGLFVFLIGGAAEIIVNVMIFFAIKTYHDLLVIHRPKTEWLFIIGLALATIISVSPLGIEYIPSISSVRFKDGYYLSTFIFVGIFTYLISIATIQVWKIKDESDRHFGILMFLFAITGYVPLLFSIFPDILEPIHPLTGHVDTFDPGSIVYLFFSLFLIRLLFRTLVENTGHDSTLTPEKLSLYDFSEREKELLPLILRGKSNQQIADSMHISLATVKTHLNKIFKKSAVKSRFELAQKLRSS